MLENHKIELEQGERFSFGGNWLRFLSMLNEERISQAEQSLTQFIGVKDLRGKRFLDAGSGSGLFSLAARRMGATVHSFDFDPKSVACASELKKRFYPNDNTWKIEEASVLDKEYLSSLGQFDVVYSWGVLHHTGSMWESLSNMLPLVKFNGKLFIAIYNDQGWISRYWSFVKKYYCMNFLLRASVLLIHLPYLIGLRFLVRSVTGRFTIERGMSLWYDMIDWIGGYPFEVARPEEIFNFYRTKGFNLDVLRTCSGRHGCNEFVFVRKIS